MSLLGSLLLRSWFLPVVLACLHGVAQTAPGPPPPSSAPPGATVLHTGTQLVVVDVVVRDKADHAVHGLPREAFILNEAGKAQNLRAFDEHTAPPSIPTAPPLPQLPPGLFTNYSPVPSAGPLNVLLLDGLNTPLADQAYLRNQLITYAEHLTPGTPIAVFGLADHLYLLQGFNSDPHKLLAMLQGQKHGHTSPLLPDANPFTNAAAEMDSLTDPHNAGSSTNSLAASALMTADTQSFLELMSVSQLQMRTDATLDALTTLAHWLSSLPGRKNLIWFSGAFPLGVLPNVSPQNNLDAPSENSYQFRSLTNMLTRAQVAVYPIDPRGLQTNSTFQAASGAMVNQPSFSNQLDAAALQRITEHATMQAIASDTGGQALYDRNNLAESVRDAIATGSEFYTLAYSPSDRKTEGQWRGIKVELTRDYAKKGYHLSYRRGYFADDLRDPRHGIVPAGTGAIPNNAAGAFSARGALVHGAPLLTDLLFTTRILPASATPEDTLAPGNDPDPRHPLKAPFRRFDVDCAAAARYIDLTLTPQGHHTGAVQVTVLVYDADGTLVNSARRIVTMDLTPEAFASFRQLGFREHMELDAPARGESFFRVALQDANSGKIGVVEIPTSSVLRLPPPVYASTQTKQAP